MSQDFAALFAKAQEAGRQAAGLLTPQPMVVEQRENGFDPSSKLLYREVVADGPCGFAWVKIKGNTAFGRWAKKAGIARKGYPNGLQIWISDYRQSLQLKDSHARAMAAVLRDAGIDAYAVSRMD